jgi:hypothetical protein
MEDALDRLRSRGLVRDDELTAAGLRLRDAIECATDDQLQPAVAMVADDLDELVGLLTKWDDAVRAEGGYLSPAVRFTWLPEAAPT